LNTSLDSTQALFDTFIILHVCQNIGVLNQGRSELSFSAQSPSLFCLKQTILALTPVLIRLPHILIHKNGGAGVFTSLNMGVLNEEWCRIKPDLLYMMSFSLCSMYPVTKPSLSNHIAVSVSQSGGLAAMRSPSKPFKCQYPGCDRSFNQRENLHRHQMHNHGQGSPSSAPGAAAWRGGRGGPMPAGARGGAGGFGAGGRGAVRRSLPMNYGRGGAVPGAWRGGFNLVSRNLLRLLLIYFELLIILILILSVYSPIIIS
jgi:hypothetical protein